jgi:IclR family pca regulon transcriptional regulator
MTSPAADGPAVPPEAVGPLVRGLAVIRDLAAAGGRRPVSALVRSTGLARATVDRVVGTLARTGYLRIEDRDAVLTPRLMELGNAYLAACGLPEQLGPIADRLADALDESVSIAVPDGEGVRFVHQATRRRAMSLTFRIGDLLPAERVAVGPLFAAGWSAQDWERWRQRVGDPDRAGLPAAPRGRADAAATFEERVAAAREFGWSSDDQLIEPGLVAIAVPVHGPDGSRRCAVSVVSHTSRHSARSLRDAVLGPLRDAVAAMQAELAAADAAPATATPPAAGPPPAAWTRATKKELGPEFVESLARGLAVLAAFGRGAGGQSLSALAEAAGLARATTRRALITLEHLGYVTRDDRLFRLTPRVLELGFAHLSGLTLADIAQPHLAGLVARVHDSASMAVLAGDDIQYVARVPTVRIMSVNITVGTRFPAYATAMGRVLLSGLPAAERAARLADAELTPLTAHTVTSAARLGAILDRAAADGYALVDEELEKGLRSIAVPVRDGSGNAVAAVNISMHASRGTAGQARDELLPPLREAAAGIEADLRIAGRYGRPGRV